MRYFLILFITCLYLPLLSQVVCVNPTKNFGEINRDSDRVVDLLFVNQGQEKAFLLTYRFPREFSVLPAQRELMPQDTLVMRYQFNPINKGSFDERVPIFFSTSPDPIELRIKAKVDFIDRYTNPQCPSFDELAMATSDRNQVTFEVLDISNGAPIKNASIRVIERGELAAQYSSNKKGQVIGEVPISYYYMMAQASGYTMADSTSYINRRNNFFRFYLTPESPIETPVEPDIVIEPEPDTFVEEEPDVVIVIDNKSPNPEPDVIAPVADVPDEHPTFSAKEFKPNNIVFLVDISGSMANKGKMDLLKASMIELLGMLRPIDQVTIVTYATQVKVVLPTTYASDKDRIKETIKNLEAKGSTAGALGVKKAFKTAKAHRIDGGNNQVIIATDGAFKTSDKPIIEKSVRKYQRHHIDLSVVGIRSTDYVSKQLSELASKGNGAFLPITDFDQASEVLVEEIRSKSRIKYD